MAQTTASRAQQRREEVHANYEAFVNRHVNSLLKHHEGDWALLHKREVIAIYGSLDEAHEDGMIKYPDRQFSIQEIREPAPVYMGCRVL